MMMWSLTKEIHLGIHINFGGYHYIPHIITNIFVTTKMLYKGTRELKSPRARVCHVTLSIAP